MLRSTKKNSGRTKLEFSIEYISYARIKEALKIFMKKQLIENE